MNATDMDSGIIDIPFDVVIVDCSSFFPSLMFVASSLNDGRKAIYELGKEDLYVRVEEQNDKKVLRKLFSKRRRPHGHGIIAPDEKKVDSKRSKGRTSSNGTGEDVIQEFCLLRVVPSHNPSHNSWILGDPFFNK